MLFVVFYEKDGNLFAWNFKHIFKTYTQCIPFTFTKTSNVLQSKDESLGKAFAFPRRNQHYARPDV